MAHLFFFFIIMQENLFQVEKLWKSSLVHASLWTNRFDHIFQYFWTLFLNFEFVKLVWLVIIGLKTKRLYKELKQELKKMNKYLETDILNIYRIQEIHGNFFLYGFE